VEARAPEEAGASLATGTKRTSASALAAIEATTGAIRPEEGRVWCGGDGGRRLCVELSTMRENDADDREARII
jgi:hypothetical protein